MQLITKTEAWTNDDQSWLGSAHGTGSARTVTLDLLLFTKTTHYPEDYVRSGTPLAKVTASGRYGPYLANTNEVQVIAVTGSPTGGSFTLTFSGQTTTAIAWNSTAAQVQAALEALSNINVGDIACTGGPLPGTNVTVTFGGQFTGADVAQMTRTSSLTGGTTPDVTVTTSTAGGAAPGGADGRETLIGFLLSPIQVDDATKPAGAALFEHGRVVEARLPIPIDAAGKADVAGRLIFV
ncbi:MAG: hypothetical protein ACT4NY_09085 [Pseudonocardiales bacterium]